MGSISSSSGAVWSGGEDASLVSKVGSLSSHWQLVLVVAQRGLSHIFSQSEGKGRLGYFLQAF